MLTRERPFKPGWYPIGTSREYEIYQLMQRAEQYDIQILYVQIERHYYCGKHYTRVFAYAVDLRYFQDSMEEPSEYVYSSYPAKRIR